MKITIEIEEEDNFYTISCKEMNCCFPAKKNIKKLSLILIELIEEWKELNEESNILH